LGFTFGGYSNYKLKGKRTKQMPSLKTLWVYGKESQLPILRMIGDSKEPVGAVLIEGLSDDIGQVIEKTIKQKYPSCLVRVRSEILGSEKFAQWIHNPSENTGSVNGLYCVKQKVPDAQVTKSMPMSDKIKLMQASTIGFDDDRTTPAAPVAPVTDLDDDEPTDVKSNFSGTSTATVTHGYTSFGLRYSVINDPKGKFCLPKQNEPDLSSYSPLSPEAYFKDSNVLAYAYKTKGEYWFALTNAVNCDGVMGAGMAKQFKDALPDSYFQDYRDYCSWYKDNKSAVPGFGFCHLAIVNDLYIFGLPTKQTYKDKLDLDLLKNGLRSMLHLLQEVRVAIPPCQVLIPKRLGNGLARPDGMTVKACNSILEDAYLQVIEECGDILPTTKLLWLDEVKSETNPTLHTRVTNISLYAIYQRDALVKNVPDQFLNAIKIRHFEGVRRLGKYLMSDSTGRTYGFGVNAMSVTKEEIKYDELNDFFVDSNREPLWSLDVDVEMVIILQWLDWLKKNPDETLVVMTNNFAKYKWLINSNQSISSYGCRSLLARSGSLNLITKVWQELSILKDRVWFTWDEFYWDRDAIEELYSGESWSNDPQNTVDEEVKKLSFGFVNYLDDNNKKQRKLAPKSIVPAPQALYTVWLMSVQALYFTEERTWKEGAGFPFLPDWHIMQKDFNEITKFSNPKLIKKKFNFK
jgi:hypothetical protein